jgi:hypothetical protein
VIRIAILIISSEEKERWVFEKSIWKQYMNSNKDIDCFFVETDLSLPSKAVKLSKNLIQVGCEDGVMKGIFRKTILALQHLENKYDFYIRTNLSTFWRFNLLIQSLRSISPKEIFYGGWAWKDYIAGFAIILNKKACSLLVKDGIKHYDKAGRDDRLIAGILCNSASAPCHTPLNDKCFYWGQEKLSLSNSIQTIKSENRYIIRSLPHGWTFGRETIDYQLQKQILETLVKQNKNVK